MPKLPLENTTLAVLTHSDAEVSALVVTEDSGKRKFLKYGAASALALSVSACGGGETLSSAEDTPPMMLKPTKRRRCPLSRLAK